ncbi:pyridoxal phosphate-dependent aminotransferase [Legionella resiliens]|uniref:Pyridoxal phosphate-dependent aminotransferase n=1 Tax=Legionella resiliens TaxID=2905958 RepID=A0ABS8X0S8_9GAMM|nr:pyridoxal phosphate-dependent aminotransferase [Legionella sp. 9fVS26]MCE3531015.1 pyridoxal phosphate-dependent aminotransferase [Legionella sp. 8cVS16]
MNRSIHLTRRTNFPQDPIDKIFAQVPCVDQERQKTGLPALINLTIGEPHLSINSAILEDLSNYLDKPASGLAFHYPPLYGSQATLEAISRLYKSYYPQVDFTENEVMISNGATQGLWNAFNILIDEGDEVLAFEPYYSTYEIQVNMLGGKLIKIPTQTDYFKPTGIMLEKAISTHSRAKALILNYPNNPTGIDLTKTVAIEIAQIVQKYSHLSIIIDDVYRELTFKEHITLLDVDPSLKNRCIVINSASKGLIGAPGMRAGMIGANTEWIRKMAAIQAMTVSSVSCLTEQVLIAGINSKLSGSSSYTDWINKSLHEYTYNIKYLSQQLKLAGFNIINGGNGFFILADASFLLGLTVPDTITYQLENANEYYLCNIQQKIGTTVLKNDYDIVSYLLHTAGVALIPGSAFGISETSGYIRFSCAKSLDSIKKATWNIQASIKCIGMRNKHVNN